MNNNKDPVSRVLVPNPFALDCTITSSPSFISMHLQWFNFSTSSITEFFCLIISKFMQLKIEDYLVIL